MTTVVRDASPFIFLAKLDRLELIGELLGERVVVLECVAREMASEQAGPVEAARLRGFLGRAESALQFGNNPIFAPGHRARILIDRIDFRGLHD